MLVKLRSGAVIVIGYMLSPLSWWNDLFFNFPIAYGFGYVFSLVSEDWFLPFTVAGYWLSNVAGMIMMQVGASDLIRQEDSPRDWKKQFALGLLSSTAYTVGIVVLIKLNILTTPSL